MLVYLFKLTMSVPKYALLSETDGLGINYLCNLRDEKDYNIVYLEEKKVVIIRDCDKDGNIVDLKLAKSKYVEKSPWVLLKIKTFSVDGDEMSVPVCMSCNNNLDNVIANQNFENLAKMCCHHTKVATNVIRDFNNPYSLDGWLEITDDDDDENEEKKVDVKIIHSKVDRSAKTQNLAVVFIGKKVSVLYTTGRQVTPTCSSCSSVNCSCVRAWKGYLKKIEQSEQSEKGDEENELADEDDNIPDKAAHYLRKQHFYGHNESSISFPLYSCPKQKLVLVEKQSGTFSLPQALIPKYDPHRVCKHDNKFMEDDNLLKLCARYTVVHHERGETVYNSQVYYRDTDGSCNCRHNYDGHEFLLFHMGNGQMVDYITLSSYVISMCNGGITAYAYHKSIMDNCKSMGVDFTCRYPTFLGACDGFVINLSFDEKDCFTCTNCGVNPKYFVGDGKANVAPLQRKLQPFGISELSSHPTDSNILQQGSKHEDRVFIKEKKEKRYSM